ncbi:MAG TPA: hypothetical protein VJT49_14815 [Amycolatopsis sp.]|uniref:hypothetical protein n=1 Tax=Amycolatopsis sp. TaxID=37632 RepID=UPI002B482499|nr:hypothetical protein [Amycolatopsis sp.]HKS46350.1 hypothetical protein [Amycolatopsis sp.]
MATITQVQAAIGGTVLTATPATAGPDKVKPGDSGAGAYLLVQNTSGSAVTVSIADPGKTKYQQQNPSITSVSVPATTGLVVAGPIPNDLKQTDGTVNVTASATSGVTFYSFRG